MASSILGQKAELQVAGVALSGRNEFVRAKPLPRSASSGVSLRDDLQAARAACGGAKLAAAISAAGASHKSVADAWGVTVNVLQEVFSGKLPLTAERIERLPRLVARAYHSAELQRLDAEEAPPSRACPVAATLEVSARGGDLSRVMRDATADGVITADEVEQIERAALSLETGARVVRLAVRAGGGGK